MRIIPVLDLKGGLVVHARRGVRECYRPLRGGGPAAQPERVVEGLLQRRPFSLFYVADLDAIEGRANHKRCLGQLAARFPALHFWVDQGQRDGRVAGAENHPNLHGVIGSESGLGPGHLAALTAPPAALSLDFHGPRFLGDPALLKQPDCWPDTLILLDLARTGGVAGPDVERLKWLRRCATTRTLLVGGGIRNRHDLARLQEAGADGALVATALHEGRLD